MNWPSGGGGTASVEVSQCHVLRFRGRKRAVPMLPTLIVGLETAKNAIRAGIFASGFLAFFHASRALGLGQSLPIRTNSPEHWAAVAVWSIVTLGIGLRSRTAAVIGLGVCILYCLDAWAHSHGQSILS